MKNLNLKYQIFSVNFFMILACQVYSVSADQVSQCDILKHDVLVNAQILDVRSQIEFTLGHLPNALHIPHSNLADRLFELNKKIPIILYCHSGPRANIAEGILRDNGFDKISQLKGHWSAWDADMKKEQCH